MGPCNGPLLLIVRGCVGLLSLALKLQHDLTLMLHAASLSIYMLLLDKYFPTIWYYTLEYIFLHLVS
jgi:hypothetical protein